jgi:hypothetical protein
VKSDADPRRRFSAGSCLYLKVHGAPMERHIEKFLLLGEARKKEKEKKKSSNEKVKGGKKKLINEIERWKSLRNHSRTIHSPYHLSLIPLTRLLPSFSAHFFVCVVL